MWNEITGHKREKGVLSGALKSGNLAHAYLFSGPEGIGKKLVARAFAGTLLCSEPKDGSPCGRCDSCTKFKSGTHPDLVEIVPDENFNITIDKIRDIQGEIKFAPMIGERRIVIIDGAELMNQSAANAALKILEEPPAGNHFILITSTPDFLLPTIVSRCQKLQFSPLNNEQITAYLTKNSKYSKVQAEEAASFSEGAIGRSQKITPELIEEITGDLQRLTRRTSASELLELAANWSKRKDEIEDILFIIHRYFLSTLKKKGVTDPERLVEKCNLIDRMHSHIKRTYNKQLMFEQLLFTLAA